MESNFKSTQTNKENTCPNCNNGADGAVSDEGATPNKGDISVCAYCCMILVFEKDLKLRAITEKELEDMKHKYPDLYKSLKKTVLVVKEVIKRSK